jgi:hypothetical protein
VSGPDGAPHVMKVNLNPKPIHDINSSAHTHCQLNSANVPSSGPLPPGGTSLSWGWKLNCIGSSRPSSATTASSSPHKSFPAPNSSPECASRWPLDTRCTSSTSRAAFGDTLHQQLLEAGSHSLKSRSGEIPLEPFSSGARRACASFSGGSREPRLSIVPSQSDQGSAGASPYRAE